MKETRKRIIEYKEDFRQLQEAKQKEIKGASVHMINVSNIINELLNHGEALSVFTLNRLYWHLRAEYIEAVKERKQVERKTEQVKAYFREQGAI